MIIKPNPKVNAVTMVVYFLSGNTSRLIAKNVKIKIVNEGGTNIVEIILANLLVLRLKLISHTSVS